MMFRQPLLQGLGLCLVIATTACSPQVDLQPPSEAGSGSTGISGTPTSGGPLPSTSGPAETGQPQGSGTSGGPGSGSSESGQTTGLARGESSDSSGFGPSTGGSEPLDCGPPCEVLIEGSCLEKMDGGCAASCEATVRDQGESVGEAFATCVAQEYLCFSTIEDCVWSELYGPGPVEQTYVFEGSGFDAWNGRTVFAHFTGGGSSSPTESAVIAGGEVVFEGTLTTTLERYGNPRFVNLFVDLNNDGQCTPGVDHAQNVWLQSLGSEFAEPNFVIAGGPTELSVDGICDEF